MTRTSASSGPAPGGESQASAQRMKLHPGFAAAGFLPFLKGGEPAWQMFKAYCQRFLALPLPAAEPDRAGFQAEIPPQRAGRGVERAEPAFDECRHGGGVFHAFCHYARAAVSTNFPVYLIIGQLLFNFFNEGTGSAMSSMLGAAPLIKKVYIPKIHLSAGAGVLCAW